MRDHNIPSDDILENLDVHHSDVDARLADLEKKLDARLEAEKKASADEEQTRHQVFERLSALDEKVTSLDGAVAPLVADAKKGEEKKKGKKKAEEKEKKKEKKKAEDKLLAAAILAGSTAQAREQQKKSTGASVQTEGKSTSGSHQLPEVQLKDLGTQGVLSAQECRLVAKNTGAIPEQYMDPNWLLNFQKQQADALALQEKEMKKLVAARDKKLAAQNQKRVQCLRTIQDSSLQLKKSRNKDSNFPHVDKWMPIEYNDTWELFKQNFVNDYYYRCTFPECSPRQGFAEEFCNLQDADPGMARQFPTAWTAARFTLKTIPVPEKKPFKPPRMGGGDINYAKISAEIHNICALHGIDMSLQPQKYKSVKARIYDKYQLRM